MFNVLFTPVYRLVVMTCYTQQNKIFDDASFFLCDLIANLCTEIHGVSKTFLCLCIYFRVRCVQQFCFRSESKGACATVSCEICSDNGCLKGDVCGHDSAYFVSVESSSISYRGCLARRVLNRGRGICFLILQDTLCKFCEVMI